MAAPEHSHPVTILLRKLEESRERNPRFSQRSFAAKLGLSSGALSEILQGKRALSHQIKLKLAPRLSLSPREEVAFFQEDLPTHLRPKQTEELRLNTDQFHLISDWWHFAILNLVRTKGFKPQGPWIARRLGLPLSVVGEAWDRLVRLGYLEKKGDRIVRKHPSLVTSDEILDSSIRKAHHEDLKLIERSLDRVPLEQRDHISNTLVIRRKDLARAKELIRVFRDQFENQIEAETGDEVYRLSVSLFPLTVLEEKS